MGSRQSRQGRPDGLRGAPRERRDIEKGDIDMKCYECLQLTDKLRVGDYGFEIWAARHDKPKQMRVKRKYRRFCEWMAEKYNQPERWIEELYDYGLNMKFREMEPYHEELQLSLFGGTS